MTIFKPKNLNNIVLNKSTKTLDTKHNELMDEYNKEINVDLPKLINEKESLKMKLSTSETLEQQLDLKDQIKNIRNQIRTIKYNKKNYLLNNSKYIFNYFEEKKAIADCNDVKTKMLNNFFKKPNDKNDNISKSLIDKYFINLDESYLNINDYVENTDICKSCGKGEMISIEHEGLMVCNSCHYSITFLIENEKPSYKEPPKEVCFYAYKRINHFREILAQFQAKETTQIPDYVLENVKLQIKKERLNIKQITNKKAKDILKKLGYNKYYEHIPFIKDKLGIRPPIMNPELEETLCNLFIDIQGPYAKYCPDNRVNFLNYHYTIYKLCELLNQKQFLPYFPMLKDREKRMEQDIIWKNICNELKWKYIPTI